MAQALFKPKMCEECGADAISHRSTYFIITIDELVYRFFPPATKDSRLQHWGLRIERALGPALVKGTMNIGLAKKQAVPDNQTLLLAKCIWEEANARGIELWEWRLFGLARNIFLATYPNGTQIVFEGIPWTFNRPEHVWWMDDKARLKKEFMRKGLAVAKGGSAKNEAEALSLYQTLTPPLIVKPHSGSGSRHTILHITNEAELLRAFRIAKQVSPQVIIEEELTGPVYRATVVGGVFAAALRRDPPSVVGDGIHTILELVTKENENPARSGPIFSKIQFPNDIAGVLNKKAHEELKWQGFTPESIPEAGRRVHFHQKVNWGLGGTTADVTDKVHPDNIQLFEDAARELHAPVAGIDFIIEDFTKSWKDQERAGILECNSMPFFDNHHLPYEGTPRNVAAAIWDMVS